MVFLFYVENYSVALPVGDALAIAAFQVKITHIAVGNQIGFYRQSVEKNHHVGECQRGFCFAVYKKRTIRPKGGSFI